MSFTNSDSYGLCKGCFKQQRFCTCKDSYHSDTVNQEVTEHCDQTFSEHNPQCQSIGEQEQQQLQQQGGLEQAQGPQNQEQIQEGQSQGPQTQEQQQGDQTQGNQTQGPQTQSQNEIQEQTQIQDQTEDQDQTQGPQLQAQRHGDQTMENNQTISTPVDVDGVNVNVQCGDCKPTIIFPDDFFEKNKKKKDHNQRGDDMENCKCKENKCPKDCDCCVQNLADLLRKVQNFQTTLTNPANRAIDIYFSTVNGLPNPSEGQVISDIVDCSVLRFRPADQITIVPNTAVQLCDVAGICATDTDATPEISNVYEFLLQQAYEDTEDCSYQKRKKPCNCPCCASGIGEELRCTANFGLLLDVYLKGQTTALPLYVLTVKDCLAYFVNDITDLDSICVFSLCAISGFTVVSQTLGTIDSA
ncbi:hypothetical protein ABW02_18515 [Niallia circulans]|uniref:Spore coat protein n=4 Tax=Bacillales TaxID=1385 RepID=A0A2N0Z8H8_9BACI|nr:MULTISPECIES: hypothetical protein [Bacillaceae]KAB7666182.1 hypothetical protein F9279_18560 [Bacillus sp. B1-b2]KLV24171.1 hypothetical protein ABW02_18515 [Niallia circulans]SLL36704.1 Uncharacterised protein [Mycobacteroides abscessus subsp. abscessus]HEO8421716.1 hypothetical protein [Yersinia enterocolitica]MBU8732471.1 hypothetical protein [Cytobacillus oceanisediminis]